MPKANREYWLAKIGRNRERDARNLAELTGMGWRSLVLFECELRDGDSTRARLARFLAD